MLQTTDGQAIAYSERECECEFTFAKNSFDFYNFCTAESRKNSFYTYMNKCSPHLNNVLILPCENETSHFIL